MTTSRKPIPHKTSAATSRRTPMDAVAARSTRRRTPSKTKKTARTAMPSWLRNVLAIFIIAIFSGAFIISLYVLMLIVGNLVTV